jgi:hypothetical protein
LLTATLDSSEVFQKIFSHLNVQSNIIVAATYSDASNTPLEGPLLFQALRTVVEQHPALTIVMHEEPSEKKKGNHRTWEARLRAIDLSECVSFDDDYDTSSNGLQKLLEDAHNEWLDVRDKTKPLWRLVVVNRTHVLFVYSHFIADGVSGVNFHQSLLSALNHASEGSQVLALPSSLVVEIPSTPLPPKGMELLSEQFSYFMCLASIVHMLYLSALRFLLPRKYWIFSDVALDSARPSVSKPFSDAERPVTKVHRMYLDPATLAACLQVCRKNNTTLTALLHVLISMTLAIDIYPEAKISNSTTTDQLRRFVPEKKRDLTELGMMNITSAFPYRPWMGAYRAAETRLRSPIPSSGRPLSPILPTKSNKADHEATGINRPVFWALARKYQAALGAVLAVPRSMTSSLVQDILSVSKLMPADDEPFTDALIPASISFVQRSFCLSNLGAFTPAPASIPAADGWRISDMEFSAAAAKTPLGPVLYFAVISVKGGACVVNVDCQEGVLKDDVVQRVLSGIERRLWEVLD